jgi:hypothetical protein
MVSFKEDWNAEGGNSNDSAVKEVVRGRDSRLTVHAGALGRDVVHETLSFSLTRSIIQ